MVQSVSLAMGTIGRMALTCKLAVYSLFAEIATLSIVWTISALHVSQSVIFQSISLSNMFRRNLILMLTMKRKKRKKRRAFGKLHATNTPKRESIGSILIPKSSIALSVLNASLKVKFQSSLLTVVILSGHAKSSWKFCIG